MPWVFVSYVRENIQDVRRLVEILNKHGIEVWLDREQLQPGYRWADAIREAIAQGDFFIACFSTEYHSRSKTYMNEELTLAIEELRQRPTDRAWFIPVLLSDCAVPARNIGAGETLRSIQWVAMYEDWDRGIQRILSVMLPEVRQPERRQSISSRRPFAPEIIHTAADDSRKLSITYSSGLIPPPGSRPLQQSPGVPLPRHTGIARLQIENPVNTAPISNSVSISTSLTPRQHHLSR